MKVDCYNACGLPLSQVTVGDTFYFQDSLYICVAPRVSFVSKRPDERLVVELATGALITLSEDTVVQWADTKIVANE